MDDSFSKTEQILLAMIRCSMFNTPFETIEDIEWEELFQEAKAQTVVPLIVGLVPEEAGI